ncbi:hypothetical protein [Curvivirga sp.]|uniref:hypothetical protein n=1 Tax=Curvivirga sp. TaxID=2856848 RepID=UPI003B594E3F
MEKILSDPLSTYYLIDPDTDHPPAEFESIYQLWAKKRGEDNLFPCWKDFDFTDFVGWHGMLIISETQWEPFEITYRIFGSEIANIINEDLTGKKSYPGEEGGFYYELDKPYLEAIRANRKLGYAIGSLDWIGQTHRKVAYMDFPMNKAHRSEDFKNPTMFMTACYVHKLSREEYLSAPATIASDK